jgi:hypothetical protein
LVNQTSALPFSCGSHVAPGIFCTSETDGTVSAPAGMRNGRMTPSMLAARDEEHAKMVAAVSRRWLMRMVSISL